MKQKQRSTLILSSLLLSGGLFFQAQAIGQTLPPTMNWSSYDVGSAGYAEASAMADAFGKKYGTKVRIQPSGSSIGRLQPVVQKRADIGFLSTETFFASEGTEDFAAKRWGPQDLRVIAGRPAGLGLPTAKDANIKTFDDLRGKRLAFVAGNPSLNVKCEAYIGFGGLTPDDVEIIMFPTYAAAMSSIAAGQSDATCTTTTPSQMYELAESPRGIHWLEAPVDDEKGWARMRELAPFFGPMVETIGAGISKDKPVHIMSYRYPVMTVRADMDENTVYAFTKAMDETYDMYKDATAIMPRWALKEAGVPPIDAPFHPGTIKYLKEIGLWTDDTQKWQDDRLNRLNTLIAAWDETMKTGKDLPDAQFAELWEKNRQAALASLK